MTQQLDKGMLALRKEFAKEIANGDIRHLGTTNCRRKNNRPDGAWSEHSWPNAVDVMLRDWTGRKALGDRVAAWMRASGLWSEVFWQIAAHYDHVHGTAKPRMNFDNKQTPPCAGGPSEEENMKELIMNIQKALNAAGLTPLLTVDGIWGLKTHNRLVTGLKPAATGPAGPKGADGASGLSSAQVKAIVNSAKVVVS